MRAHTAVRRLTGASTLKPEVIKGVDMVLVRELTGGIYFGSHERFYDERGADSAPDIADSDTPAEKIIGTADMGDKVVAALA